MPTSDATSTPVANFLAAAHSFEGINSLDSARGQEMLSYAHRTYYRGAWCAVFVMACAGKAGILGTIIADTWEDAPDVLLVTENDLGGVFIEGPAVNGGVAVIPEPGDLVTFSWHPPAYTGREHADHIGIVDHAADGRLYTIEGNSGGAVRCKDYALDDYRINMYVRPDWTGNGVVISDTSESDSSTTVVGPLYDSQNDRHDMTLRQVGYLDNDYKLSNSNSSIGISVINYTTMLGELYDMFAPYSQYKISVDTSQLPENTRIAVDYFLKLNYSASSASALVGCLKTYSGLQPAFVEDFGTIGKSIQRIQGIAAWNNKRWEWVNSRLSKDDLYMLSPQLSCVSDELDKDYPALVNMLKPMGLSILAVQQATMLIMNTYNDYFPMKVEDAKDTAVEIYNMLVITKTHLTGSISDLRDQNGNKLEAQYCVEIPSDLPQTGILDYYTSYSKYYLDHWYYEPKKLATMWGEQGFPSDKAIATIGGYYCVAVIEAKFGHVGDVLVVTLSNGAEFPAIIADTKGSDAKSEWGHVYGGNVSIIEWERVKTDEWGYILTGWDLAATDVDYSWNTEWLSENWPDWWKQDVSKITNYGSYFG